MDHKRCLAILQSNMDEEITKASTPFFISSNVSKCPCEFHNLVGSLGYWDPLASKVAGLLRLLDSRVQLAP